MDLQQIGVELVALGGDAFNGTLDAAASAVQKLVDAINPLTAVTNAAENALQSIGYIMDTLGYREVRLLELAFLRYVNAAAAAIIAQTDLKTSMDSLATSVENIAAFNLDPFLNQLGGLVAKVTPAVEDVVNTLTQWANTLGQDALTWGSNVVDQFAQGMWDAIGSILDALNAIGSMISSLLAPGSPPKLLPDLDKWGTDAANIWLEGWGKADFTVFDNISKEIETLLRSASASGKEKDTNLIPTILGTREAIAEAVEQVRETGQVTADSLNKIYVAAGATTPELQKYLKAAFDLELANKNLTAAQDNLNAVTEKYDDLLQPINEKLAAINAQEKEQQNASKIFSLEQIEKDPNATAAEKALAATEIQKLQLEDQKAGLEAQKMVAVDTANAKVEAAKKAQTAAQAEYDTLKGIIDLQTEQNKLLQEQEKLLDSLEKKAKATKPKASSGVHITPESFGGGLGDLIPKDIQEKLKELEATFKTVFGEIMNTMKPVWDAVNNFLIPSINNLWQAVQKQLPNVETEFAKTFASMVQQTALAGPLMVENMAKGLDNITAIINTHGASIIAAFGFIMRALWTAVLITGILISDLFLWATGLVLTIMDTFSDVFQGKWDDAWKRVELGLALFGLDVLSSLNTIMDLIAHLFGTNWDLIAHEIQDRMDRIVVYTQDWIASIQTKFQVWFETESNAFDGWLVTVFDDFIQWFGDLTTWFTDTFVPDALSALDQFTGLFYKPWFGFLQTLYDNWKKSMDALIGLWNGEAATIVTTINTIITAINAILDAAQSLFNFLTGHIFNFHLNLPTLPPWATPGSPTPFEIGLRGIADALELVNSIAAPSLAALAGAGVSAPISALLGGYGGNNYNYSSAGPTYNYSPVYGGTPPSPATDFTIMRVFTS